MSAFNWPVNSSVVNSGPVQYQINGVNTTVNKDTVTPSNSTPLPVTVFNTSGVPVDPATSAKQDTGNVSLASIDSKLTAPLSVTGPLTDAQLRATAVPVSQASQPLPTGASTSALQTAANASLTSIDSKLTAPLSVTGPLTDTQLRATAVPVSAAALPLPTGAATSANQTTEIASLSSIDTKTPALGQALAAASVPVVLTAAQVATLTPLTTVAVTGPLTDTQLRATPVPVSGTVAATTPIGTLTDRSGTTSATPLTASTLAAINATRKYLFVQNNSAAGDIYITFTSSATATNSIVLKPYATYEMNGNFVSSELISVASNVASATFSAKEA